jgi:hypothetical protein
MQWFWSVSGMLAAAYGLPGLHDGTRGSRSQGKVGLRKKLYMASNSVI